MSARGHVEGRRLGTPDAKILDTELAAEDRVARAKMAKSCDLHLADLIRFHGVERKSAASRPLLVKARRNG